MRRCLSCDAVGARLPDQLLVPADHGVDERHLDLEHISDVLRRREEVVVVKTVGGGRAGGGGSEDGGSGGGGPAGRGGQTLKVQRPKGRSVSKNLCLSVGTTPPSTYRPRRRVGGGEPGSSPGASSGVGVGVGVDARRPSAWVSRLGACAGCAARLRVRDVVLAEGFVGHHTRHGVVRAAEGGGSGSCVGWTGGAGARAAAPKRWARGEGVGSARREVRPWVGGATGGARRLSPFLSAGRGRVLRAARTRSAPCSSR